ncbi:hypothetical protein C8R43DRAFT_1033173 [Mycena crocata]|nr:hypothetical protein C8R43DRAFT_1033173 [Mycena crocata]
MARLCSSRGCRPCRTQGSSYSQRHMSRKSCSRCERARRRRKQIDYAASERCEQTYIPPYKYNQVVAGTIPTTVLGAARYTLSLAPLISFRSRSVDTLSDTERATTSRTGEQWRGRCWRLWDSMAGQGFLTIQYASIYNCPGVSGVAQGIWW